MRHSCRFAVCIRSPAIKPYLTKSRYAIARFGKTLIVVHDSQPWAFDSMLGGFLSLNPAVPKSRTVNVISGHSASLFSAACLLAYWIVLFSWSGRGFDFSDEAYDLSYIANPSEYLNLTNFGDVWHPLYVALGTSIGWFRSAGMTIFSGCAILFASSLWKFAPFGRMSNAVRAAIVLGVTACLSWQYQAWKITPDYNLLNLCGLLLFYSGLLRAQYADELKFPRTRFEIFGPAILSGIGIAITALAKPTTAVVASLVGVAWVVTLRPRNAVITTAVTALTTIVVVITAMIMIDGSVAGFIANKMLALDLFRPFGGVGNVTFLTTPIYGVFLKPLWKIAEVIPCGVFLFVLAWCWISAVISERNSLVSRWAPGAIIVVFAILVVWWRNEDISIPDGFVGFRLWRMPFAMVLAGTAMRMAVRTEFSRLDVGQRRAAIATLFVALAPAVYSFGTDNLLIWHATSASIFWAGALVLLAGIMPVEHRNAVLTNLSFMFGALTLAMLGSVISVPGRIGLPLWEQTAPISMGRPVRDFFVNAIAADYIESFRHAAFENGWTSAAPVLDMSEVGSGLLFALGAHTPVKRPYLLTDGRVPNLADRRAALEFEARAIAPKTLQEASAEELRRAWIITGERSYLDLVQSLLNARGLNFPARYHLVAQFSRSDLGWTQSMWKPVGESH